VFDPQTLTAYAAASTPVARAQAVRDSLGSGTLTVELRDGETLVYSGTFAGPMTAGGDGSLSADALLSGLVGTAGTPNAATWTCRIRNGDGRWIEGSFGPGGRFTFSAGSLTVGQAVRLGVSIAPAGVPSWVKSAPLMTWQTLPSTRCDSVMIDPTGKTTSTGFAWCGAALKIDGSEIFMMTGGHDDGYSNSIYSLKLKTESPAWVRRNEPSYPITSNASHNPDGTPTTCHTYWNIQFNQSRNLLMWFGRAAIQGNGNTNVPNVDAFDPVTNQYLPAGTFPAAPGVSVDRPIVMIDDDCYMQGFGGQATISKWTNSDGEFGSWENIGRGDVFSAGPAFVHDPARNRIVRFDRYRAALLALGETITITSSDDYSGDTADRVREKCSAAYVPAGAGTPFDDRYVVTEFGSRLSGDPVNLHVVHPDTFAVTVAAAAGTKPTLSSGGSGATYGRLMYIDALGIIVLPTRPTENV